MREPLPSAPRVVVEQLTAPNGARALLFRVPGMDGAQMLRAAQRDPALAAEIERRIAEAEGRG